MDLEITPQPTESERAAILAALAQDDREDEPSPWAEQLLPQRTETSEP